MKRILINATQNEEIRVALCTGNHLYDFDLENRTREQKKSNIYKGHVTRVEPSLEAVFVEYGSQRQGFLPIREISSEYLSGNPRDENIKKLIKEGDELIVQVEKEERGNKGAALSTYVSLAGRYLVLMPNNPRGGGISRQISGKLREDMKRMLGNLDLPKGMSVIIRTAGIGKTQEDLQHDLNHLLNIWQAIQEQNQKYPSPRLVHQEAGVVTRAVRDYLRDDISEIWIDNENAYIEAAGFIDAVMPKQAEKLRKYTDYEPMFSRFNIEKQIETAYQREVRLPSGGSIVIDQTEALVSIDINSAKSTKGSDVAETAFHTNLEAADEIARQLRLRDMGGLIVIDFIDMNDSKNQKEVEKRLIDATKYDRARVQFGDISKFGLMEMSRQRLRPSLEESTGYICPRCHGNGMIRDLRSLSLSIMRQIEQIALKERQGEVQAEVPTDIAAFLLNEKRDSLVYLEQDSGTRITILPHAHLESPNFKLHFNRDGFAPSSYERITDTQQQEHSDLGYNVDWQTSDSARPEQQPTRQPRQAAQVSDSQKDNQANNRQSNNASNNKSDSTEQAVNHSNQHRNQSSRQQANASNSQSVNNTQSAAIQTSTQASAVQPKAVAWLSNLFAQAPQAQMANVSSHDAAEAIEALVNTGAKSLGASGQVNNSVLNDTQSSSNNESTTENQSNHQENTNNSNNNKDNKNDDRRRRKSRKPRSSKPQHRKDREDSNNDTDANNSSTNSNQQTASENQRSSDRNANNERNNDRNRNRQGNDKDDRRQTSDNSDTKSSESDDKQVNEPTRNKRKPNSRRNSRGGLERSETLDASTTDTNRSSTNARRDQNPDEVVLQVNEAPIKLKTPEVVHLSLDDSKITAKSNQSHSSDDKQIAVKSSNNAPVAEQQIEPVTESKASEDTTDKNNSANDQQAEPVVPVVNEWSKSSKDTQPVDQSTEQPVAKADVKVADVKAPVASEQPEETAAANVGKDFALDHKALFASRYVAANKFGQASNDPRVVRARNQQASSTPSEVATDSSNIVMAAGKIRGSVGAFIRTTLADAETRLAADGVITCFIAAIALHTQQTATAIEPKTELVASSTTEDTFEFSNYGYESLSADYLTRFKTRIEAVSQTAIAQGKTEVAPRAISKRADNDPRGQHPDFVEEQSVEKQTQVDAQQQASSDTPVVFDESDKIVHHEAVQNTAQAVDIAESTDTNADERHAVEAKKVAANALTGQAQADDVTSMSEQRLEGDQVLASNVLLEDTDNTQSSNSEAADDPSVNKGDVQAEKSKTTIASYKNMIENVAEQLLPQTGMFNLTAPKVPKARSRKPKVEHKKPTQAEKLDTESDDIDSDS